ncbi:LLM class flavin-dependent oxidoreductase [Acrocarpospora macrocephala]|uniref:Luciferase n=1 Tax=Acrocarpospora macrocephala TaxID=150177 RepID=A0A5M3WNA5_9ACTN|nr:LLM class flavin-dependent oxidoreductase [Acrocarpospora macrocephala]GES07788.1 luciferase [Acrocarpospora macrocephala]
MGVRVGVLIWAGESWSSAVEVWRRAEEWGFSHAWVYDHVEWRGVRPWFDAYAVLAAAAAVTSRIGLGPLVTTPNFRHPVPAAHALKTVHDISGGRLTVGLGAGSDVDDLGVLGAAPPDSRERAKRFAEWVELLELAFGEQPVSCRGRTWSTTRTLVGGPRPPFAIAAGGPRGMRIVARHAQTWVTLGNRYNRAGTAESAVRRQLALLDEACVEIGRDPGELDRLLLSGVTDERPLASVQAFDDYAGRYEALGITDIVVHWPVPGGRFAADLRVLEQIARNPDRSK